MDIYFLVSNLKLLKSWISFSLLLDDFHLIQQLIKFPKNYVFSKYWAKKGQNQGTYSRCAK
tara:strand:- start:200 stop:382 length:183 start_codon:yes stop_codon:yes gene_type:complete